MSLEELSRYAPEILELLPDDREKRRQARDHLQKGYNFSKEQAFALIPSQRTAKALAEISPNPVACTSSLSRLRKELRKLNAPKAIIEATKIPGITTLSNKIQKEKSLLCEDEGIHYPDHFSLESVKERLDLYDISNTPDKQALADVMIMLCICPAEIKDLYISNGGNEERAKQLLTWIQEAISSRRLGDPGMSGTGILSRFLKKTEFLPKTGKPLLSSSLRNLGAVFAVVASGVRNLSKANTIASQAF
ncbi:hypothetical protein C1645_817441 [Glomus cerebriforme]|uniref:Uncharacterized protein n=1 Tax=Glomus cerebriforme TaxID=658196 RepID=A0A397TJ21_9GLOM|nr:hypothetical protein C1645_817441 [Glomus cerebriforme]